MYEESAQLIKTSKYSTAFTGAGISVESGIPPFRGKNGLWNKYDPAIFEISYFLKNTKESWQVMQDIFYELFGKIKPNYAHTALAELENLNLLKSVITQNIDNLHTDAGSRTVYEFHGSLKKLICMSCNSLIDVGKADLNNLPPKCSKCRGILKPDVIFFGESIPKYAYTKSFEEAHKADLFILIGTTGKVVPANMIPQIAKGKGAKIIEINTEPLSYTHSITDIFLQGKAAEVMDRLMREIKGI